MAVNQNKNNSVFHGTMGFFRHLFNKKNRRHAASVKLLRIADTKQEELAISIETQIVENLPDNPEKLDKIQAQVLLGLIGMYETVKGLPTHFIEIKHLITEYNDLLINQTKEIAEVQTSVAIIDDKVDNLHDDNKQLTEMLVTLSKFIREELPKIPMELQAIRADINALKSQSIDGHTLLKDEIVKIQDETKSMNDQIPNLSNEIESLNTKVEEFQTNSENETSEIKSEIFNLQNVTEQENERVTSLLEKILRIITFGIYKSRKSEKTIDTVKVPNTLNNSTINLNEFYIPAPNKNGNFNIHMLSKKYSKESTYYRLFYAKNCETALFEFVSENSNLKIALNNAETYIEPACKISSSIHENVTAISTVRYGIAEKMNNIWKVKQKAIIEII